MSGRAVPGAAHQPLFAKCERYHDRGVAYYWVIDLDGTAWEYHRGSAYPVPARGAIAAGEMRIELASVLVDASD